MKLERRQDCSRLLHLAVKLSAAAQAVSVGSGAGTHATGGGLGGGGAVPVAPGGTVGSPAGMMMQLRELQRDTRALVDSLRSSCE